MNITAKNQVLPKNRSVSAKYWIAAAWLTAFAALCTLGAFYDSPNAAVVEAFWVTLIALIVFGLALFSVDYYEQKGSETENSDPRFD